MLREINGTGPDGAALSAYTELKDDGSTALRLLDLLRRLRRRGQPGRAPQAALGAGPGRRRSGAGRGRPNRRILYNRASADPDGKPWSERKKYVWWDAEQGRWTGADVPDFVADQAPDYVPAEGAKGPTRSAAQDPFIMQTDGKAWLFAPSGVADGPLPTHYEPPESPVHNPLYGAADQPVAPPASTHPANPINPSVSEVFPYVFTTYRLTEHHTAGGMSRTLPYLAELQPELFCEVSPRLAAERGLEHRGWATIVTARTAIEARVLVTERMRPLRLGERIVHQIGLPYHWGRNGITQATRPTTWST